VIRMIPEIPPPVNPPVHTKFLTLPVSLYRFLIDSSSRYNMTLFPFGVWL
jgi:hypothetical protein